MQNEKVVEQKSTNDVVQNENAVENARNVGC